MMPGSVARRKPRPSLRWVQFCAAALLVCSPLFAIDRDLKISQLYHTTWGRKDGLPAQVWTLAQTTDGFLWVGGSTGLYRFDGIHFEPYQPPAGQSFPNTVVHYLLATPDGGLWIGFEFGGLAYLKAGKLTIYPDPGKSALFKARALARDQDGTIWCAGANLGLSRFVGSHWEKVGREWDPPSNANDLYVDREGTLWVDNHGHGGLAYLPKGGRKFQKPAGFAAFAFPIAESPTGSHLALELSSPLAQIHALEPGPIVRKFNLDQMSLSSMIVDQQGSLWIATQGHGINRTQYPERADTSGSSLEMSETADVYDEKDGLTSNIVNVFLEDREGDIWVGTNAGLDRFRQTPLITVKLPSDSAFFALTARDNGDVWVTTAAGSENFFEIHGSTATAMKPLPRTVRFSYRDPDGVIWVGPEDGILRLADHKIEKVESVKGFPMIATKDSAGRLVGLFNGHGPDRLENGHWKSLRELGFPKGGAGVTLFSDAAGTVWEGYRNNLVTSLEGDKFSAYTEKEGITVGVVSTIRCRNGSVWIGGDGGLERLAGARFQPVLPEDGSGFHGVLGFVATPDNGVWLGEKRGIIHIDETESRRVEQNPAYRVKYQVFDVYDGLSDELQRNFPQPNMIQGTDGRLWFATNQGIVWLDPKRVLRKPPPPAPVIVSLTANGQTYDLSAPADIKLPPRTVNLQFAYTAPSLAIPERVHFRYQLEGSDKEWRDAGASREASYTNLGPGRYRFHLMASNGNGVWTQAEAVTPFLIQPAYFQTYWFYGLCLCAMSALLWELYRMRLRQISAQMQGRLEERLSERERIARELHDTLLQSFQGLMLRLQVVDELLPPGKAKEQLELSLDRADRAIVEARSAVHNLRSTPSNDLPQALQDAANEMVGEGSATFRLVVEGVVRNLDPILGDEVYRIACECLRNAFKHASANSIEAELTYGERAFRLRIRDDGCGIPAEIQQAGRSGHYGLSGIRERARQAGCKLDIWSGAGSGTEIELTVPRSVAYRKSATRFAPLLRKKDEATRARRIVR